MSSCLHEVLVGLFQSRPSLAVELLSDSLRFAVPAYQEVVVSSADLTKVVPAERRADAVLLVQTDAQPVLGVVFAALPEAARAYLETLMTTGTYEYKSDFARRYFHQGRAEGLSEGRAEGEIRALLTILTARGVQVPDDAHTRITTCTDPDQLDTWIQRASTAATIHDVLD